MDNDTEMLSIKAIAEALEPLDLSTRERVLSWARDRYIIHYRSQITEEQTQMMVTTLSVLKRHAEDLGVTEQSLIECYSVLRRRLGRIPSLDAIIGAEDDLDKKRRNT